MNSAIHTIRRFALVLGLGWLASAMPERPAFAEQCFVVCPVEFRQALQPWVDYRLSQGMSIKVVPSAGDAPAVRQKLLDAGMDDSTEFLVLVGDCRLAAAEQAMVELEVPTFYRAPGPTSSFGTTPTLAGDAPYGDLDGDGVPEVAVGRLPVDNPDELKAWIERIRVYESSSDFGMWRDRVQITAGVGGFGFLADKAIESATRSILTSSMPPAVRLAITYSSPGSPFNPGAIDFFPATLRRYHEGGLFWVYLGHGRVTALDSVPGPGGTMRPVLSCDDLPLLECPPTSAPIAVVFACYTGAFDASVDCLAERMVKADGGPIAILAGSRVTMPYGNSIAAQGLIHAVYEAKVETLGAAWLAAQQELATEAEEDSGLLERRQMVDLVAKMLSPNAKLLPEERLEHLHLYNLLGDPTLRIRHPETVTFSAPTAVRQGSSFVIRGQSPQDGELNVSLCHFAGSVPLAPGLAGSERYEAANCLDIVTAKQGVRRSQPFELEVSPPTDLVGRVHVVVRIEGKDGWATAAQPLLIHP